MKDILISYFLCAVGLFTPLAGLHRFYLNKNSSGIAYLLTWGFFGIGTIIDLIRMPTLVDECNRQALHLDHAQGSRLRFTSPEKAILKCARDHDGTVTIQMVALSSGLSMAQAKNELDRLNRENFCTKDVDEEGNEIYQFKGLKVKKPLV